MGWIVRFGLLSGLTYISLVLALNAAIVVYARHRGSFGIYASRPMWVVLFTAMWLISFSVAYVTSPLHRI